MYSYLFTNVPFCPNGMVSPSQGIATKTSKSVETGTKIPKSSPVCLMILLPPKDIKTRYFKNIKKPPACEDEWLYLFEKYLNQCL